MPKIALKNALASPLSKTIGLPILAILTASTINSFHPGISTLLIVMPVLLSVGVWCLCLFFSAIARLFVKQWKSGGLKFAGAVVVLLFVPLGLKAGDYIHLLLMYPYYRHVIAEDAHKRNKPVGFDWGNDGYLGRTLVYDATPVTRQSVGQSWSDWGSFKCSTKHLIGDFYLDLCDG